MYNLYLILLVCLFSASVSWNPLKILKSMGAKRRSENSPFWKEETKETTEKLPFIPSKNNLKGMITPMLLFMLSEAEAAHAGGRKKSLLGPHAIPLRNPFFQGWLVRGVDHTCSCSFLVILGAFSSRKSGEYDEYYIFSAFSDKQKCHQVECLPHPDAVRITVSGTNSQSHVADASSMLDTTWIVDGVGKFSFRERSSTGRLAIGADYSLHYECEGRKPWSQSDPDRGGPEGWLARFPMLLPCHYFVHTMGSPCHFHARTDASRGALRHGHGYAHIEGNYGTAFPEGWIWSQGIASNNTASLSVVGGRFTIGCVSPLTWVIFVRIGDLTQVFRTTDLDNVVYSIDPEKRRIIVEATQTLTMGQRTRLHMVIEALSPPPSSACASASTGGLGMHIHVPTEDGFSNDPGCRETYTAHARLVLLREGRGKREDMEWAVVAETNISLVALEFGGTFQHHFLTNMH